MTRDQQGTQKILSMRMVCIRVLLTNIFAISISGYLSKKLSALPPQLPGLQKSRLVYYVQQRTPDDLSAKITTACWNASIEA